MTPTTRQSKSTQSKQNKRKSINLAMSEYSSGLESPKKKKKKKNIDTTWLLYYHSDNSVIFPLKLNCFKEYDVNKILWKLISHFYYRIKHLKYYIWKEKRRNIPQKNEKHAMMKGRLSRSQSQVIKVSITDVPHHSELLIFWLRDGGAAAFYNDKRKKRISTHTPPTEIF